MKAKKVLPKVSVDAVLYYLYRLAGSPHGHTIAAYQQWAEEMVTKPFDELAKSEPDPQAAQSPRIIDTDEPLV